MTRRRYLFDTPDRFVAGTVGEPGNRVFFLQARDGTRVVSVALEKVQVAALIQRLDELLDELERRGIEGAGTLETFDADPAPLDEPINEAFRAGTLSLGWDTVGRSRAPRGARAVRGRGRETRSSTTRTRTAPTCCGCA